MSSNHEDIQAAVEKKILNRQKKKRQNMKISGRSVKNLQKIIINKSQNK